VAIEENMRIWGAGILLALAGCGGVIANGDSASDSGASSKASDAGSPQDSAVISTPVGISPITVPAYAFTPIDTTDWLAVDTTSSCSFDITTGGATVSVVGSRVVAFVAGTEIPYLAFGCSGQTGGKTYSFLGGTISYQGNDDSQWAYVNVDQTTVWIDDEHIAGCDLEEWSAAFGTIGTEVSGSFACNVISEQLGALQIANGYYDTVFTARTARDLPP
jgi:hypothetical protein